jgi:hypothetical protein
LKIENREGHNLQKFVPQGGVGGDALSRNENHFYQKNSRAKKAFFVKQKKKLSDIMIKRHLSTTENQAGQML